MKQLLVLCWATFVLGLGQIDDPLPKSPSSTFVESNAEFEDQEGKQEHMCRHDHPRIQRWFYSGMELSSPQPGGAKDDNSRVMSAQSSTTGPLRFVMRTDDLFNNTLICTAQDQERPDFLGGRVNCTNNDKFDIHRRNALLYEILPPVLKTISNMLTVNQRQGNLVVPGDCGHGLAPHADKTSGVPDADYVLYVSAAPVPQSTSAWAHLCFTEALVNGKGPAIVGRLNVAPSSIWGGNWGNNSDVDHPNKVFLYNVILHEMIHALGFTHSFLQDGFKSTATAASSGSPPTPTTTNVTVAGGQKNWLLSTSSVKQTTVDYFGCDEKSEAPTNSAATLGAPLEQGKLVSGQIKYVLWTDWHQVTPLHRWGGSHWARRYFMEEIMAPVVTLNSKLSVLTQAFFRDMGWYHSVNGGPTVPTQRKEKPAEMYYGKGLCTFLTSPCNTTEGGLGREFCDFDGSSACQTCSADYRSRGGCRVMSYKSLPQTPWWQYFVQDWGTRAVEWGGNQPYMDYCPVTEPFKRNDCSIDQYYFSSNKYNALYYGQGGRCFLTPGMPVKATCMKSRCVAGKWLQLQIGGRKGSGQYSNLNQTDWFDCPQNGSAAVITPPSPFKGTIKCPEAKLICHDPELYYAPPATEPPTPSTTTASAPTTVTTTLPSTTYSAPTPTVTPGTTVPSTTSVSTTVVFFGTFPSSTSDASAPTSNDLSARIAKALGVPEDQVDITSFNQGQGTFSFQFVGANASGLSTRASGMSATQLGLPSGSVVMASAATFPPTTSSEEPAAPVAAIVIPVIAVVVIVIVVVILLLKKSGTSAASSTAGGSSSFEAETPMMMQAPDGAKVTAIDVNENDHGSEPLAKGHGLKINDALSVSQQEESQEPLHIADSDI